MARSLTLMLVLITLLDSGTGTSIQRVKSEDDIRNVTAPPGTFLPGMKLGVNHKKGYIWSHSSAPGPLGSFTLSWEPQARQLHISLGDVVYWSSGVFKDGRFQYITLLRYNFTIVSNKDEDSITYSTVGQTNRASAWLLKDTGDLYDTYTGDEIAQTNNCDGYSTDRGCLRRLRPPSCMATFGDEFKLRKAYCHSIPSSVRTPYYSKNVSYSVSECKAACWQDCECVGFDIASDQEPECRFWSVDCQFDEGSGFGSGSSFVLSRLISLESPPPISVNPARKWIWIGTVIVSALLVIVIVFACYLQIRRVARKLILSGRNGAKVQEILTLMKHNTPTHYENEVENDGKMGHDISVFSYKSILAATGNFSDENKLGEGGFGSVYQGKLLAGQEIAVKKLSKNSEQGALEFKNELVLVYELQHTNLVRLFGFCIQGEERMLIYEYLPNKSLDYFLFGTVADPGFRAWVGLNLLIK